MSLTKDAPAQLQPLSVVLSALHLPPGISALHRQSGIDVSIPKSETSAPVPFQAIVSESTDRNLLLKSFYDSNVRGKVFDGTEYQLFSLESYGISRCAFTTIFGIFRGQPALDDHTAPQFNVDGVARIPFMCQGHLFSPEFLICDHIFCRQEYEPQFVAVLSLHFLKEFFIRAQYNENGWKIQPPPYPVFQISELPIYTDGCCLSNGLAAGEPARGGYGIHFPTLPSGWDMYGALASSGIHTNQKAELTAVIRALQLVRLRKIPCANISIFTDSKYAVQGLNEWIPDLWRSNGYRTTKNRDVVNGDLFRSLDEEVSLSINGGIPVTLSHVPREQNRKADALSKQGATSTVPSMTLTNPGRGSKKETEVKAVGNPEKGSKKEEEVKAKGSDGLSGRPGMLLGKDVFRDLRPLVQWTPDGVYWAEWQSLGGLGNSPESGMRTLIV